MLEFFIFFLKNHSFFRFTVDYAGVNCDRAKSDVAVSFYIWILFELFSLIFFGRQIQPIFPQTFAIEVFLPFSPSLFVKFNCHQPGYRPISNFLPTALIQTLLEQGSRMVRNSFDIHIMNKIMYS